MARMLTGRKLEAQIRSVCRALPALMDQALVRGRPADRSLAAYLREHRELGGRDRRLLSEGFFAALRWWGWLQRLAPPAFLDRVRRADSASRARAREARSQTDSPGAPANDVPAGPWERLLLGALILDGGEEQGTIDLLASPLGLQGEALRRIRAAPSAEARAGLLLGALEKASEPPRLTPLDLIPPWAAAEIQSPRPIPELIGWFQSRPPLWLRAQAADTAAVLRELAAMKLAFDPHPRLKRAIRIRDARVNLFTVPVYRNGWIEVQDLASQAIGEVCGPRPGERWWDACAGGGGKSLLLAQLMTGKGTVVATDVREYKLEALRLRARRGGFSNIAARPWDGKPLRSRQATFDGVLVDAPCSGSGTWRRNPAARWNIAPDEVSELGRLQSRILAAASSGVKPGGVLVYATCSIFRTENDAVVDAFLGAHPEFSIEPFEHPLTGEPVQGRVQIWPWDGECDGMFAARLRRTKEAARESRE